MTKVEELRKKLYDDAVTDIEQLASAWGTSEYLAEHHMKRVAADLDAFIVAVEEQTKEKIRNAGIFLEPLGIDEREGHYAVPAYALAPEVKP